MDKILAVIFIIAVAVFVSFLMSWPVYMLWNGCLVGAVSGVNEIDWTTAWGITLLCGMLFKDNTTK